MAEPVVSFLLETIGKLLNDEVKLLSGVSKEAKKLHSELKLLRAVLRDADEKQQEAAVVKEWVFQSKDLAYEAENVLETHAFKLASRKAARGSKSVIRRYASILNECYIRHKVGLEIRSLKDRVSNLKISFEKYGMRAVTEREGSSSQQQQWRTTYPYVADDEDFVGFEKDIEKLVHALVDSYGVVSICGMGGSGKTTLARKVYNHRDVRRHFDSFAWVCISQQWQTRDILLGILASFLPGDRRGEIKNWTDSQIVEELLHTQQNKKCLVVLDDIWSIDAWECVKDAFPMGKEGSKILITSRKKDVAMHIGPNGFHHEPRVLTNDESWELLRRKALRGRPVQGDGDVPVLEVLGKEIVKFCGGLPLAVVVLGGILATKHSSKEWNMVYRNVKSYLSKGEKSIEGRQGEVHKILALSYNELPYKLKPCFLYLSAFSEDEEVDAERLYQLWMAEGMVFAEDRMVEESMMDVAERYLEELAKRCIIQVQAQEREAWFGGVKFSCRKFRSCRLHDVMRDFCIAKAEEENFLKVLDNRRGNESEFASSTSSSAGNIHRLVIHLGDQDASVHVQEGETNKHLRTLMLRRVRGVNPRRVETQLGMYKMLRSLTIEGVISSDPEIIENRSNLATGNLIHLRYLSLRWSKLVVSPSSISSLEHLETLDLSDAEIIWTKNVPLRMQRLRYLYLPDNMSVQIYAPSDLEILRGKQNLGKVVGNLSELVSLQELHAFLKEPNDVEEIINLISHSDKLNHVTIVFMDFTRSLGTEKVLAVLAQLFRRDLQYLFLRGHLGKLPEYEPNFLRNILELNLVESSLKEDPMGILEKLPNLQTLRLANRSFEGTKMACHSRGFPQLRFLLLRGLFQLKKWTVEKGSMPNLSRLHIVLCTELEMIPEGVRYIETLKELEIEVTRDEFLDRVRMVDGKKGKDFDKICHIPSIKLKVRSTLLRPAFLVFSASEVHAFHYAM